VDKWKPLPSLAAASNASWRATICAITAFCRAAALARRSASDSASKVPPDPGDCPVANTPPPPGEEPNFCSRVKNDGTSSALSCIPAPAPAAAVAAAAPAPPVSAAVPASAPAAVATAVTAASD